MVDKISTLAFDFSVQPPMFSGWNGARHSIVNKQLNVVMPGSTSAYYILASTSNYDVTGSWTSIECVQALNAGSGGPETGFQIKNDLSNYAYIFKNQNSLKFRERVAASNSDTTITYNSVTHRFWRLRSAGTTLYWETSPDGSAWTVQRSKTTTLNLASMSIEIIVGSFDSGTATPGTAIFDNLNMPHPRSFFAAS